MQLELWQILVLAVVQGVTEFLPISSSGHLVVLAALLSPGDVAALDVSDVNIVLHLGTLLSILVFYWRRVWRLIGEDRRTLGLLVVGTLPAVIAGLPIKKFAPQVILENPLLAGAMLPVTGVILLATALCNRGSGAYEQLTYGRTLLIGISQALAILPGLSRSGTTIAAGMGLGLAPRSAATFSFLLAVPAIAGAGVLELLSLRGEAELHTPPSFLLLGLVVSFVVGLGALAWLVRWIEQGRFWLFALWCIPLGLAVITWQLGGGG